MADNPDKKTSEQQDQIRAGARAASAGASDAMQATGTAAEQTTRAASAALRNGADTTAQAMHRGSEAGGEAVRHMGDAVGSATREGARTWAEGQRSLLASATEHMHETAQMMARAVQDSAEDMRALMVMPRLAGDGIEDMHRGMERLVSGVIDTNLRSAQELLRLGNMSQFVMLQQRFMREYLDTLVEGSSAFVRSVRRTAEQTLRPYEQQLEQRRPGNGRGNGGDRQSGRVADVMQREPRIANPDDTVQQAARVMRDNDTGALPVGEGDRLVGMITDRDVAVRLIAEGRDPARTKVREVMTPDVRYVFDDEDMGHVADNMAEQQVRRLPVVNRAKRLVGVVSLSDIARKGRHESAGQALGGITREGGQHTQTAAE